MSTYISMNYITKITADLEMHFSHCFYILYIVSINTLITLKYIWINKQIGKSTPLAMVMRVMMIYLLYHISNLHILYRHWLPKSFNTCLYFRYNFFLLYASLFWIMILYFFTSPFAYLLCIICAVNVFSWSCNLCLFITVSIVLFVMFVLRFVYEIKTVCPRKNIFGLSASITLKV